MIATVQNKAYFFEDVLDNFSIDALILFGIVGNSNNELIYISSPLMLFKTDIA